MTKQLSKPARQAAIKSVTFQGTSALICAVIVFIFGGELAAKSVLAGSIVALLPYAVFALYAFRFMGGSQTQMVYKSFIRGAGLKFLLTITLFVLFFKTTALLPLGIFLGFVYMLIMQWLSAIFFSFNH